MTDIVERLRTHTRWPVEAHHDALEAADILEMLRAELDRRAVVIAKLNEILERLKNAGM